MSDGKLVAMTSFILFLLVGDHPAHRLRIFFGIGIGFVFFVFWYFF